MEPLVTVSGAAAPLMTANTDTDIIVRINRLTEIEAEALGPYAFESWRYDDAGEELSDFILNQNPWRDAPILLAGPNFGCGSSREGAVWALAAKGVRVVIAPSFGPIFHANCFQNGVLPLELPLDAVDQFADIARTQPEAPFTVDLERCVVVPPNGAPVSFAIDERRRRGLLQGLDDLGLTLSRKAEIDGFQSRDAAARPWIYLPPT